VKASKLHALAGEQKGLILTSFEIAGGGWLVEANGGRQMNTGGADESAGGGHRRCRRLHKWERERWSDTKSTKGTMRQRGEGRGGEGGTGGKQWSALLDRWVEALGPRIRHLHLHDNDGSSDQHYATGEGTIDWPLLLAALRGQGLRLAATLEVEGVTPSAASIAHLRALGA